MSTLWGRGTALRQSWDVGQAGEPMLRGCLVLGAMPEKPGNWQICCGEAECVGPAGAAAAAAAGQAAGDGEDAQTQPFRFPPAGRAGQGE